MLKRLLNKLNIHIHKYEKTGEFRIPYGSLNKITYEKTPMCYIEYEYECSVCGKIKWE